MLEKIPLKQVKTFLLKQDGEMILIYCIIK
jgi:hypothetical protein